MKTDDYDVSKDPHWVKVLKGKGKGQVRLITCKTRGGSLTFAAAWDVEPDASSVCVMIDQHGNEVK